MTSVLYSLAEQDLPKRPRPSSPPPTSHHVPRPVAFTPLTPPHQLRAPLPHTLLPEHRKALTSPPPTSIMGHYHNPYAKAAAAASPGGILPAPSAQPSGILPAPHVPLPPPVLAPGMHHYALPPPQLVKQAPRPAPRMQSETTLSTTVYSALAQRRRRRCGHKRCDNSTRSGLATRHS